MSSDIMIESKGNYNALIHSLKNMRDMSVRPTLVRYAKLGVEYLKDTTPVDTGETRDSWYYEVEGTPGSYRINFCNSDTVGDTNVAILVNYGHVTRNGGWVEGRNFIGPAIQEAFDQLASDLYQHLMRY